MNFSLPKSAEIAGRDYALRWDYRDVLTILIACNDPDLSQQDKTLVMMDILFEDFESMPTEHWEEAAKFAVWFIDGGSDTPHKKKSGPRLMDWEYDYQWIIAPVNRVIGRDIREDTPLHWWTFLSAYYEIGDCTFAQIVRIRDLKARGKLKDKADREWARKNADLVQLPTKYSEDEENLMNAWTKGGTQNAE